MKYSWIFSFALVLGSVPFAIAQEATEEAKSAATKEGQEEAAKSSEGLDEKVKALVKQLDSSEQAKREEAEKALVELGPEVVPLLPSVGPKTPAEVKNRLARIRSALSSVSVQFNAKPSLVTLNGVMNVPEAFEAISKQTGNKLIDRDRRFASSELPSPTIKVTLDKVPFWEALDTVLDHAEMTVTPYVEDESGLAYSARGEDGVSRLGKGYYSGVFRLEPVRVVSSRDLRNTNARTLKITLDVEWEPRMRPVVLQLPLADLSAKDEKGELMVIDGSEGNLEIPVEGKNSGVEIELPLGLPSRDIKQVGKLKGKMTAVVLGRVESFEFTDLEKAKGVDQERGGVIVTLDRCRRNDELFDAEVRVKFGEASKALESHRGWIYNNECYLLDPKGNMIENAGLEANLLDDSEVGLSYKFDLGDVKSLAGYRFVYKTPADILNVPVEFELQGIDLP
ncbi:MAG: hypothetical protein ACO1RA_21950 [Planctomycetaceae bacterium]